MPDELKNIFFARLYGRCRINDEADGDPLRVWDFMSHKFNNALLTAPHQVHGTTVITADNNHSLPLREDADGVFIGSHSKCCGSLRFADCTPVVIAGTKPSPWMLLLHSGFVGTMKNISGKALAEVTGNKDGKVWAWIGPGMSFANYSRNKDDNRTKEALSIFAHKNVAERDGLIYFDVQGQIEHQLEEAEVISRNIFRYYACTFENSDVFYSYRSGDVKKRIFLIGGDTTILNQA